MQPVLLIDEIDKADIEFPNDLLRELDRMEFFVYETRELVKARHRPIILITSNNEKELPDAFLRRCFFHYIRFPDESTMRAIVDGAFPGLKQELLSEALTAFFERARDTGTEEEALHLGAARLDQAVGGRGHRPGRAARRRPEKDHSGPARRAAEERAGRAPVRAARVPQPPRRARVPRHAGAASSSSCGAGGCRSRITEFLTLLEALRERVAWVSAQDFYYLARTCLVKDERHYDRFDRVFAEAFEGAEKLFEELMAQVPAEWLKALTERTLSEEEKRKVEALGGWEKLLETLRERCASRRSGTRAATSGSAPGAPRPFGAHGYNPEGIRIGQPGSRNRRAVKVWDQRDYRNFDDTVELGTRNMKMALRKLRKFAREGAPDQLDLDGTIDATARNAGLLDLKLVAERRNAVKVLLFLDVGGSMDDHVRICEELFSAARGEFKHLVHFYFHNFLYEHVWQDNRRRVFAADADDADVANLCARLPRHFRGRCHHEPVRDHCSRAAASITGTRKRVQCGCSVCVPLSRGSCG